MIPAMSERWIKRLQDASLFCLLAMWPVLCFSSALTDIFLWLSFSLCVLSLLASRQWPTLPDRTTLILLGLFLTTVVISMFVSEHSKQSFRGLIKVLRQIVVFVLVYHTFQTVQSKNKLLLVVLLSFLVLVSDGYFQYIFGFDFIRGFKPQAASSGLRISASFEQYGKLAAYLCTVLPFIVGWAFWFRKQAENRIQFWLITALSFAGLGLMVLTRSRGAFLALCLGFATTLLLRKSWKTLGVLFLAGVLFIAVLPRSMIIHLDGENKEQSLVERVELWHRAWNVIAARPLMGTGINTYAVAHQEFDTRKSWRVQNYYAHNGYLQMAAEIGLPGLFFFLAFLVRWAWINRPRDFQFDPYSEVRWGLYGGIIAFMIFCLADTAMHSLLPIITFFFALSLLGAFNPNLKRPS